MARAAGAQSRAPAIHACMACRIGPPRSHPTRDRHGHVGNRSGAPDFRCRMRAHFPNLLGARMRKTALLIALASATWLATAALAEEGAAAKPAAKPPAAAAPAA